MIDYNLLQIRAIAFDIDGVLSSNVMALHGGAPIRTANVKDGYVLQLAAKSGLIMAIITGGTAETTLERYAALGIQDIYQGCHRKIDVLVEWMKKYGLQPHEVLYMGDDIPDYEAMKYVGCSCCPNDAATEIKEISTYVSSYAGGQGCVRDVVTQVLKTKGLWMSTAEAFGW